MIHPDKVKEEAKKKADENYKFRSYLKGHADEEELDRQFMRLHKELFADYDCSKCRNCCRQYPGGRHGKRCRVFRDHIGAVC